MTVLAKNAQRRRECHTARGWRRAQQAPEGRCACLGRRAGGRRREGGFLWPCVSAPCGMSDEAPPGGGGGGAGGGEQPGAQAPRVLLSATFTIEESTAKCPFCCMVVMDATKRKALPAGVKLRQMVPTAGLVSTSLWEATDVDTLRGFLEALVGEYCSVSVATVTEDQAFNLPSASLSEQAAAATEGVQQKMADLDHRFDIRGKSSRALSAAKDVSDSVAPCLLPTPARRR